MTERPAGHPVRVEFHTPSPLPVTALAALTDLVQGVADHLNAGTLAFGKHVRQEGDEFVFSFAGHAPTVSEEYEEDPDELFVYTAGSKDPIR